MKGKIVDFKNFDFKIIVIKAIGFGQIYKITRIYVAHDNEYIKVS